MINITQIGPPPPISSYGHVSINNPRNTATTFSSTAASIRDQGVKLLDSSALVSSSVRLPNGGWISASVFKHENHSANNPLFVVKGVDINGWKYEAVVNINDVNPNFASFIEMMALDGHFMTEGKPIGAARSVIGTLGAGVGVYNVFTMFDFLPPLQEMMVFQRSNGNLSGYAHYKNIIDSLLDFIARK